MSCVTEEFTLSRPSYSQPSLLCKPPFQAVTEVEKNLDSQQPGPISQPALGSAINMSLHAHLSTFLKLGNELISRKHEKQACKAF